MKNVFLLQSRTACNEKKLHNKQKVRSETLQNKVNYGSSLHFR